MDKVKWCTVKSRWILYDPSDPAQVPDEDGNYFALVKSWDDRKSYLIVIMTFYKNVQDLISIDDMPWYERQDFLQFMKEKYKYGAFTEPMMGILPNYPQDYIIAFRMRPAGMAVKDLVNTFVTLDEFDKTLKEAEDRLNQ